jgi:hypothetical protein
MSNPHRTDRNEFTQHPNPRLPNSEEMSQPRALLKVMATPAGFEPATFSLD